MLYRMGPISWQGVAIRDSRTSQTTLLRDMVLVRTPRRDCSLLEREVPVCR
jgi:hypothetical protein